MRLFSHRNRSKAQIAIEYLILFGFQLIIVGLLWTFSTQETNRSNFEIQSSYAKNALNKLIDTSDLVSIQGPPAQTHVNLQFPENIRNIYFANNTLTFEISFGTVWNNVTGTSNVNLTGSLSAIRGTHRILVKALSNSVEIMDV